MMNARTSLIGAAVLIALLAVVFLLWRPWHEKPDTVQLTQGDTAEHAGEYYTCPMHPSVISDRPGACPVCGMALVKRSAAVEATREAASELKAISLSPTQRVMANIETVPVRRGMLHRGIDAVGVVSFAEPLQATVAARFRGRIERLFVNATGQQVRKGDPLFALYSPDLISAQQEYLLALGNRQQAGSGSRYLNAEDVQQQLLDAARERLRVYFGLTEGQVADLERTRRVQQIVTIYSPMSGTVIQKQLQEGQYVDDGMVLYQLADLSRVWVYLDVSERDLRFVRRGQEVIVSSDAYPGTSFRGKVTFIDPVINNESRTIRVRSEFPNRGGQLKPNMYMRATFHVPAGNSLLVPAAAILATGKRNVVWVEVRENAFEPRDVITGTTDGAMTQVLEGLREGEMVAATGGFLIDSESALQQPSGMTPHTGHGPDERDQETVPEVTPPNHEGHGRSAENRVRDITITVDGVYSPEVVRVKKGEIAKLHFFRKTDDDCAGDIRFPTLGIERQLPAGQTTVIEIAAAERGEVPFHCGMNMVTGKLIVE